MAFSDDDISLNPLKRVKFISMVSGRCFLEKRLLLLVSIPSNGSSLFQSLLCENCGHLVPQIESQSPQTGQVYFNARIIPEKISWSRSESRQTAQVYFNCIPIVDISCLIKKVSIPSNGSSLFQFTGKIVDEIENGIESLNPLKRVKFISIQTSECSWFIALN